MAARKTIVGVFVFAALLLVGCGDHRSAATKAMNAKFERIDYKMMTLETVTSQYNASNFEKATRQYIALVREYADLLGRDEARRRIKEKGDELGPYCLPCAGTLEDEARKY